MKLCNTIGNHQERPACFTVDQWGKYLSEIEESDKWRMQRGMPPLQEDYCRYCTPAYRALMRASDLCNHDVTWHHDEDEGIIARRITFFEKTAA